MPRPPRVKTLQPRVAVLDTRSAKPPAKQAAPIYLTREHQHWRATVIARARGRCEWPGCGRAEQRMFADHIVELKDGGAAFDVANGQCLCGSHHTSKTNAERARRMGANMF
jgi:5-methylcytosine-specific restriction protein A